MSPFVYCEDESMRLREMMVIAYGFRGALVERYDETHAILVAASRDTLKGVHRCLFVRAVKECCDMS